MKNVNSPEVSLGDVLKTFWQAVKPQKGAVYLMLVGFFLASVLRLLVPLFYKIFFDVLVSGRSRTLISESLIKIIVAIFVVYMVAELLFFLAMYALNKVESQTMARLKQLSFNYMIRHSHSFFANNFTGALVQRVSRFSRSFERLYDTFIFNIMPLAINVVGVTIIVWFNEPMISYIIIAWVMVIITFNLIYSQWKLKYDLISARADSTTTALLADNITNQSAIALFTNIDNEAVAFKKVSNDQAKAQSFTWNLGNISDAVQIILVAIVEFCIFYYAIKFWQRDILTFSTFVLFQVYLLNISHQLWGFSKIIRNLYEGLADAKEMVVILKTPHEITDLPDAKMLEITQGRIDFNDATFSFHKESGLIQNFNLSINGGEKVALIGPSGAGKSTIVRLLLRYYDVIDGAISIDDQNVRNITQDSLYKNISMVPQEPVLFHRTIMENIRYGRPEASDQEVMKAAQLAHCDEFIEGLPLKYETFVGERGIKLSGGERQRVAIARAILKNAPILILDEATSSLDSHSEALIQDALDKLMSNKTSIVIAHRLSTIRKMDRIIVVEGGKIIEDGSHEELLNNEGSLYKKLWNLQAGGFISA